MNRLFINILLVAAGGAAGSVARYAFSLWFRGAAQVLPLGTLLANILGSFCAGFLVSHGALAAGLTPELRLLLLTGFCGGFTTLSSFVYESTALVREGSAVRAGVYAGGTLLLSVVAYLAGDLLVRVLHRS